MAITISGENNNDKILASDGVIDQISGFSVVGVMTATSFTGDLTGNVVGNVTGNINNSTLLLQTGGSERFRITGNNELGIAGANYGSAGQVLTSGGSGNAVSWTTISTDLVNDSSPQLGADLDTNGFGILVDDNKVVNFGHNNDLMIYHSGTHSYIKNKTNNLYIMSTNTEYGIEVHGNGKVRLNYNNSPKIETTNTGAVVTGILTATQKFHAVTTLASAIPILVERTHNNNTVIQYKNSTSSMYAGLGGDALGWGIDDDANIGVDPMFFVERTTGKVGIGSGAPAHALDIQGSSGSFTKLALSNQTMNTSKYEIIFGDQGQVNHVVAANREITFATNGSSNERLRITSGGKVGINENNPSGKLEVKSTGATAVFNSGAASDGRLEFEYNSSRVGLLAYHSDRLEIQTDSSKDFTIRTGGVKSFSIGSDNTPAFFSSAVAWHEGPAILEASNGYAEIFFRSTGSTHGTSTTGTWSIGKLAGTDGFGILKNGLTGGGAVRQDAALSISNDGHTTIGKFLITPKRPSFRATREGSDLTITANNIQQWNTVSGANRSFDRYTVGGYGFNTSTHKYKIPVTGVWFFHVGVYTNSGHSCMFDIRTSTQLLQRAENNLGSSMPQNSIVSTSVVVTCNKDDEVYVQQSGGQCKMIAGTGYISFGGHFIG